MIVSKEFKNIKCDNCGALFDEENWYDSTEAFYPAFEEENWIEDNGKHYCPDCYSYDDDDNLVIDKSRKL